MIRVARCVKSLEFSWKKLIDSDNGPFYLSYEFHKLLYRNFRWKKFLKWSFKGKKLMYVCSVKNNDIVAIAPLVLDHHNKTISFVGNLGEAGYNDFIYDECISTEYLEDIIEYLKMQYTEYTFNLLDLRADSKLCQLYNAKLYRDCYKINVYKGYEEWLHSLSKNMRQTIRTAYNRLQNDNTDVSFIFTDKVSFGLMIKVYYIYEKRLLENKTHAAGKAHAGLKDEIRLFAEFVPKYMGVPFFRGFNEIKRARIGYLTINKKVASFIIGYVDGDGIICPRCGFDSKYARYSPGLINMIEVIKSQSQNTGKFVFDLSRGYHEYKPRMGGVEYDNLAISCNEKLEDNIQSEKKFII